MDPVDLLHQGYENSGRQFFLRWNLLFASAQYENLLNVTLLAPSILRLIIDFLKICGLLYYYMMRSEGHKAVTLNLRYSWTWRCVFQWIGTRKYCVMFQMPVTFIHYCIHKTPSLDPSWASWTQLVLPHSTSSRFISSPCVWHAQTIPPPRPDLRNYT